jgi:hypothetical protein
MTREPKYPAWLLWLWEKGPLGLLIALAAIIVPISGLAWYLDSRLRDIEDQLRFEPPPRYSPPDLEARAATGLSEDRLTEGQVVYVPAYSHVYYHGGRPCLLETLLSIRNTDPSRPIYIGSVRYYDTGGELKTTYVRQPVRLRPLETLEFLVEEQDTAGGSGANFIVEWMAEEPVSEPLIETVMVGSVGTHGVSFARSGRALPPVTQSPAGKSEPKP